MKTLLEIQRELAKKYQDDLRHPPRRGAEDLRDSVREVIDEQLCQPVFEGLFIQ